MLVGEHVNRCDYSHFHHRLIWFTIRFAGWQHFYCFHLPLTALNSLYLVGCVVPVEKRCRLVQPVVFVQRLSPGQLRWWTLSQSCDLFVASITVAVSGRRRGVHCATFSVHADYIFSLDNDKTGGREQRNRHVITNRPGRMRNARKSKETCRVWPIPSLPFISVHVPFNLPYLPLPKWLPFLDDATFRHLCKCLDSVFVFNSLSLHSVPGVATDHDLRVSLSLLNSPDYFFHVWSTLEHTHNSYVTISGIYSASMITQRFFLELHLAKKPNKFHFFHLLLPSKQLDELKLTHVL